jgi:hypothetical protein
MLTACPWNLSSSSGLLSLARFLLTGAVFALMLLGEGLAIVIELVLSQEAYLNTQRE